MEADSDTITETAADHSIANKVWFHKNLKNYNFKAVTF